MRKLAAVSVLILFIAIVLFFCQTARDPEDFSGEWYTASDQNSYLFQEGLIYQLPHGTELTDAVPISGAYSYSRQSVFLFAEGITGLERGTEIYLVRNRDGSFLCENRDGSGTIYFIRYH